MKIPAIQPLYDVLKAWTGKEPPVAVRSVKSLHELDDADYQMLQDWAADNANPDWGTGIGLLEAAEKVVDVAIENNNIEWNGNSWVRT